MCVCVNYTCKFDCVDMFGVGKITVGLNRV